MAEGRPGETCDRMGVQVEKSFSSSSGMNPRYDYATKDISKTIRGRAESVKNVVKSFESLKDISRPFRLSRESLRDLSKSRHSEELIRSTESIEQRYHHHHHHHERQQQRQQQQQHEILCSIKSAPASIESVVDENSVSDVFSFTFDLPSPFSSLNHSPVSGSPGSTITIIIQRYQDLRERERERERHTERESERERTGNSNCFPVPVYSEPDFSYLIPFEAAAG